MRALPSSFYGYFKFPPKVVLFSSAISRADVASCDLIPTKNHKPRTEQESECMGSIINGLPALPVRNYAWQTQIKCRNCATWKSGLVARDPFPIPRTKRMSSNYKLHNQINLAKPYNLFILPKHIETHTNWFQTGNCNFLPNKVACIGVEYIYILWAGHTDWPAYCQQNTNQINYTEGAYGIRLETRSSRVRPSVWVRAEIVILLLVINSNLRAYCYSCHYSAVLLLLWLCASSR